MESTTEQKIEPPIDTIQPPRKKKKFTGLKYKEKHQDIQPRSRSRSPTRYEERRRRSRDRHRRRDDRNGSQERPRRLKNDNGKPEQSSSRRDDNYRDRSTDKGSKPQYDHSPPRQSAAPAVAAPTPAQEMILVTINDRLGTKKQIPCLPTDTIKDFKAIVASMIGRRPHEILLKRQSERPFKDFLTLQDYGVSHGASLDLEVDTGD